MNALDNSYVLYKIADYLSGDPQDFSAFRILCKKTKKAADAILIRNQTTLVVENRLKLNAMLKEAGPDDHLCQLAKIENDRLVDRIIFLRKLL
jgi:hypothetical protein